MKNILRRGRKKKQNPLFNQSMKQQFSGEKKKKKEGMGMKRLTGKRKEMGNMGELVMARFGTCGAGNWFAECDERDR